MNIDICQNEKNMYSANFSFINGGKKVGSAEIKGWVGGIDGNWSLDYKSDIYEIRPEKQKLDMKKYNVKKIYRPYTVCKRGEVIGHIFHAEAKHSFFSSSVYTKIILNQVEYDIFGIGLGNEGGKRCVYRKNTQIALIEAPCEIFDMLYNYHLISIDEFSMLIAIIACCYGYGIASFKPGEKVEKSVTKLYSRTTDKFLISKYSPEFKMLYENIDN